MASVAGKTLADFPKLVAQIDRDKHPDLDPAKVGAGSSKKLFWKCDEGADHQWPAFVYSRTTQAGNCPFCVGQRVSVTNSLATKFPEIASQWHPTKNGDLIPEKVVAGSHKKCWWKCSDDHEWEMGAYHRTARGQGCPYCSGVRVSATNNFAAKYPKLAKFLDPVKNGDLTPFDVSSQSGKKYWWKCDEGADHEWQTSPSNLSKALRGRFEGTGCPCCSGRKVSVTNSLQTKSPEIAREWHPTKNGDLTPEKVTKRSGKNVYWQCPKDETHIYRSTVDKRVDRGTGCPYCSSHRVHSGNSLARLFPDVAKEWHPIKNGDLTPDDVIGKSHKKAYWQCPKDDAHVWDAVISSRTGQKTGCPYCANQRVSVTNNLQARFPEIAKQWHPTKNGDKKPEMFTGISGSYAWWICHKGPDHEWRAQIAKRTSPAAGRGCPCCAGYKLSVTNRLDLNDKAVAEEWHPTKNGELKPNDVVLGSNKNVWWLCSKCGYEWRATVNHRAYGGTDCAECTLTGVSKKEIRVAFEIYKIFGLEYIRRPTIKFGSKQLRPDILIEEQNLVVEYDGARYHKDRESFDQKKTDALQKAGWKVIRVRETPLEMITENDISVRPQEYNKSVAGKVLQQIEKVCGISIPGLDDYLKGDRPINKQAADEHIATLLRDKQQTTLVENS